jgi:hypothetical protein
VFARERLSAAFRFASSEIDALPEEPPSVEITVVEHQPRGAVEYQSWKADMLGLQARKVAANDAVLVANLEKNEPNYLGGATFLEVFTS